MVNSASEMLIAATIEFLQSFPPFDRMESDALRFLAERVKLAYYPKETQIITPEAGVVPVFRILQRGKVVARPAGNLTLGEQAALTLGPGEGFPIGSAMAQRASSNVYTAISDVFCYELAVADFFLLLQKSAVFNLFCTQYIASLLSQSRQQLQTQFSQRVAEQQTMNSPLASVIKRTPISVRGGTPVRSVVEMMAARTIGSMIVVDDEERPVGIFTQSDVLKRIVLPGASLDQPIEAVMSPHPHTLPLAAKVAAWRAALAPLQDRERQ